MFNVNLNTQIYRPIKQVFTFISTPENDTQWQYGTLESSRVSEGPIGLGTFFRSIGHFMGRRLNGTFEVTEYEPYRKYGFKSLSGSIESETIYSFEMDMGSTKINIFTQASIGNHFKVDEFIVAKRTKKQIKENLEKLKDVLEAM
jgi:hypothetical protein